MAEIHVSRPFAALSTPDTTAEQDKHKCRSEIVIGSNLGNPTCESQLLKLNGVELSHRGTFSGNPPSDESMVPLSTSTTPDAAALSTATSTTSSSKTGNAMPPKQKRRSSLLCGLGPSKEEDEDDGVENLPVIQIQSSDTKNDNDSNAFPSSSFSDWMANLPAHAQHKPFNQLSIPGSHDSCTASLDRDGGLHPDAPELYRDVLRVLGSWAKTVALRWSQTQ